MQSVSPPDLIHLFEYLSYLQPSESIELQTTEFILEGASKQDSIG